MKFNGFPEEFINFLLSLQFLNTTELLPENKISYKKMISEPLASLHSQLTPAALEVSESIITKPSKCISTMYNDMRFSKGAPLKDYMYLRFREPFSEKDALELYFDMGYTHYSYGIRIYKQTSPGMEKIRTAILKNQKAFLAELKKLSDSDIVIYGANFAKDRYPDISNEMIKSLLNKKNFYIGREHDISPVVHCSDLADEIADAYQALRGIYLLLKKALY